METRTLGTSDLRLSLAGLGCNNFGSRIDLAESRAVINAAIDVGITFFDTADGYGNRGGSETIMGEVLAGRRQQVIIATKFGSPMDDDKEIRRNSPDYIRVAAEASLRRLKTDYIDLYQIHFPDPEVPIEETMGALQHLVEQGKVRSIGCSNFSAAQLQEGNTVTARIGAARLQSCQNEYSLLVRDVEAALLPAMRAEGVSLLPFFPLASGMLTGKYHRGEAAAEGSRFAAWRGIGETYATPDNFTRVERLTAFAEGHGHTILELAMSWIAAQPTVASVIAGASRPEQVRQNVSSINWQLDGKTLAEIDELLRPEPQSE